MTEARQTQQVEAFEAAVDHGVSYELLTAVRLLVEGADEAEVSVEWDRSVLLDEMVRGTASFAFRGTDVPILDAAATALATPEPVRQHTATGWVHLLSKRKLAGQACSASTMVSASTESVFVMRAIITLP